MEEMELKIQDIFKMLRNRWKIIAGITAVITLFTALLSFFVIKAVYEANTKVFIGKDQSYHSYEEYDNSDVMMYQNLLKTYSELLKSNDLIENAINRNDFDITPEDVISSLEVTPRADTQILEISYQNNDNVLTKEILVSVINEFINNTKELIPNGKVKVIESVKLPEFPVKPNKEKNIAIACLTGLMIGGITAFFLEYIDDTLKTKDQTEKTIELPVIGMIPCECSNNIKKSKAKHVKNPISA